LIRSIAWLLFLILFAACSSDSGGPGDESNGDDSNVDDSNGANNGPDPSTPNNEPENPSDNTPEFNLDELPGQLRAMHRSGQTFLTWSEPDPAASYHVYRSDQPITSANLSSATQLTSRWGPLDADTSVNRHAVANAPSGFVIEDLGQPLSADSGLFVHTSAASGNAWYAVTAVLNGTENRNIASGTNTLTAAVAEQPATPAPILTVSVNGGLGRIYTQYMDYGRWNPTFNGYAFNYMVALPFDYDISRPYPLQVELHAFGNEPRFVEQAQFGQRIIQIFADDPGEDTGSIHTWWYGHAADHNYQTSGDVPTSGRIENFTEQRVLKAVDEVIERFNVDTDLVHVFGNSMGASGALTLGLRYPDVFAGIYSSQPMTDYAASPLFQFQFRTLFGEQSANLPIVNNGRYATQIADYDLNGTQPTGVWDWMDHQQQLRRRRGDEIAFLTMDFGKADDIIDWQTQGQPMFAALNDGSVGFAATALEGIGHSWQSFNAVNADLLGFGFDNQAGWRYPRSLSYPSLQNASGSASVNPGTSGDSNYNQNIDWSAANNNFHQAIVDSANRYEISLRSLADDQTVDVTPRNTQNFRPSVGSNCNWQAQRISGNEQTGSGSGSVDNDELYTAIQVPVSGGTGTRLTISCT